MSYQRTRVVARELGREIVDFPGGHLGFMSHPAAFAEVCVVALVLPKNAVCCFSSLFPRGAERSITMNDQFQPSPQMRSKSWHSRFMKKHASPHQDSALEGNASRPTSVEQFWDS